MNGTAIQFSYLDNGQVGGVNIGPADNNGNLLGSADVITSYTPDPSDGSRLGQMKVISNQTDGTLYDENITGYYQTDQRSSETVTRQNPDGTTKTDDLSYTYDPSQGDALTSVTDNGTQTGSFAFDGAGNYTGNNPTANALGAPNLLNQYANYTYNGRTT